MDQIFAYGGGYLASQFDEYLKTNKAETPELSAFFDGYILGSQDSSMPRAEIEARRLLQIHRHFGYLISQMNPLKTPVLSKEFISNLPSESEVPSLGLFEKDTIDLATLIQKLQSIYAGSIGYEFLHCRKEIIEFLTDFIEKEQFSKPQLDPLATYEIMARTEYFETFLHTRFPGQKRFSLEGLETSIVLIQEMLEMAEAYKFQHAFFGMAHRGRLNLLANIFQKPLSVIFQEFSGSLQPHDSSFLGDVKYHQGATHTTKKGMNLTLSANPSHLEAVDPVVLGMSYACQKLTGQKTITCLIHGDASFAGQGVVYETMQMSKIKNFDPKGVIHIIQNNQIGFTAIPEESRSTPHPTDLAKMFNCPIFHVNAEDIKAIKNVSQLAIELVHRFEVDIMIDLIGYRKWGHNESDEPSFTQPLLYQKLKNRQNPLSLYREQLVLQDADLLEKINQIDQKIKKELQTSFQNQAPINQNRAQAKKSEIAKIDSNHLHDVALAITKTPSQIQIHPKIAKLFEDRHNQCLIQKQIDFPLAELLAIGMLLKNNISIRFVGQDSARGTFSQRHAIVVDQITEQKASVFDTIITKGQFCEIVNSLLSEFAVLGFEYGFSKVAKNCSLSIWEAQFGDFANSAQVIIDQFIASGHTKWNEVSNLTLLLPHGYEGQGPEHTSARIERFLELCAQKNMIVAAPTSPMQYFHLLLKQSASKCPLIVFTPKALLRHPECKSSFDELIQSHFMPIIDDENLNATIAVFCFGKIYYDLKTIKTTKKLDHLSLIRLEQLYPFEKDLLMSYLKKKPQCKKLVLVQDEPENMGAYMFLKTQIENLHLISRPAASSPATGFHSVHKLQYEDILRKFESL